MTDDRPQITIYTDGGAEPNPGPGGWGAILIHPAKTRELSGGHPDTTNNRMELTAAIEALSALTRPCMVELYTDSEYLRKGITEWMPGWLKKGKLQSGKIKNADLWQALNVAIQQHDITWHWVKGHAGNHYNERADELASAAIPRRDMQVEEDRTRLVMLIGGKGSNFGYAAAVVRGEAHEIITGTRQDVTVNHFAILAAVDVLEQLPPDEPLQVFTNNSFLFDGITKWINGWKKKGFKKFEQDWRRLDELTQQRGIRWALFKSDAEPDEVELLKEPLKQARIDASNT